MPLSPSRVRLQNLLPIQVFSCWNGLTIFDAALFEPPTNLRFRSKNGLDTHSECYLFCSDIWKDKSPLNIDGTPRPGKRGARIQVVPRTSVGYAPGEYEKARQDRNTTAFEVDGLRLERVLDQEMVKWEVWPPKLIQNYPSGERRANLPLVRKLTGDFHLRSGLVESGELQSTIFTTHSKAELFCSNWSRLSESSSSNVYLSQEHATALGFSIAPNAPKERAGASSEPPRTSVQHALWMLDLLIFVVIHTVGLVDLECDIIHAFYRSCAAYTASVAHALGKSSITSLSFKRTEEPVSATICLHKSGA